MSTVEHRLTEHGTVQCPLERIRAEVDEDGECSACGTIVTPTAADQPTTEPSAYYCGVHGDLLAAPRSARCAEAPAGHEYTLAPAPQPAADTETEVQWGVRYHEGSKAIDTPMENEERARSLARIVDATVVHRTITRTPWEEA